MLVDFVKSHLSTAKEQAGNFTEGAHFSYVPLIISSNYFSTELGVTAIDHFKLTQRLVFLHIAPSYDLAAVFISTSNRQLHHKSPYRYIWLERPYNPLRAEWTRMRLSDAHHAEQIIATGRLHCILKYI